jgi:acyl-CoA reductase-like NAD-dependent aldehyde dehydrogenase
MPFDKNVKVQYTQLFINNEYVDSEKCGTFETVNPATGKVITKVQDGQPEDIDRAVKAAAAAFHRKSVWRTMDASERTRLLLKMADIIEEDIDYISSLESIDCGKSPQSAKGDVQLVVKYTRYYAGLAQRAAGSNLPADNNVMCITRREPVGVVGGIVPWNYPFHLAMLKVAPALAAGCTIVVKPAENTPLSAIYIGHIVLKAGFPPGVVNIVPGFGVAGKALIDHPLVNKISFTGSVEVGRLCMKGAAESNLKRVTLELGGKSPVIVCNDAGDKDLESVAALVQEAALVNHGQCCVAGTRTYVQSGIY